MQTIHNDGLTVVVANSALGFFAVAPTQSAYALIATVEFALNASPQLAQGVSDGTSAVSAKGDAPVKGDAAPAPLPEEAAPAPKRRRKAKVEAVQAELPLEQAEPPAKPARKARRAKPTQAEDAKLPDQPAPAAAQANRPRLTDAVMSALTSGEKRVSDLIKLKDVLSACSSDDPKLVRMVVARTLSRLTGQGIAENIGDAYRIRAA